MTEDTKHNIDDMCYQSMLQLWRHAQSAHPYFQGEIGDYFSNSMNAKRAIITDEEHTRISKNIGWD